MSPAAPGRMGLTPARTRVAAGLVAVLLLGWGAPPARGAGPEVSAVPGQPGGDPAPDTKEANRLVKAGRYEQAIAAARRALARDERHVPAMVAMAK